MAGGNSSQCELDEKRQKCFSDGRWCEDSTSGAKNTIYRSRSSISSETKKKTGDCSKKCYCPLTETLTLLKAKILENSKTLEKIAASDDEGRCKVELTRSEEKLFRVADVKGDSVVCCVLVRQLRAQKRDLESMLEKWVEFVEKADRFRDVATEIRDKLAELTPRIESILREARFLEEIELENEEARRWETDEELRRSEARREIFREAVDQCAEAEAREHLTQLARRGKLEVLDREKFTDRSALKPALRRMIKAIVAEGTRGSAKRNETSEETPLLYPENNATTSQKTAVGDASPGVSSAGVSPAEESRNRDNPPGDKRIPIDESEQNRSVVFCTRAKVRRPF